MRNLITTLLDLLGLLVIAAGLAGAVWQFATWLGVSLGGFVLLIGSAVVDARSRPKKAKT